MKELQGVPLTTGTLTKAALEKTKDGADFKVVFRKGRTAKATVPAPAEPPAEGRPLLAAAESRVEILPLPTEDHQVTPAEELVRHFHRVFHGAQDAIPTGKALDQAASLIAQLGMEKARYVVDFARREAAKTRYQVATFGGLLQYTAAALREFERTQQVRERQRRTEQAHQAERRRRAEEHTRAEAEAAAFAQHFASLTPARRAAFQAEALAQAESYHLGFLLKRYHQQPDKNSPAALATLQTLLVAHFQALGAGDARATGTD